MKSLRMRHAMLATVLVSISACKNGSPIARVKLDNGQTTDQNINKIDAVFFTETRIPGSNSFGSCTGTAVSTTTIITAGHCVLHIHKNNDPKDRPIDVYDSSTGAIKGKEFCVTNHRYNRICSTQIFVNLGYPAAAKKNGSTSGTADSAYVVFPEGTFKSYFNVSTEALAVNDKVLMVGYSVRDLPKEQRKPLLNIGLKRFGYNIISGFDRDNQDDITTLPGDDVQGVALSPGDSGGPMFKDCKVTGVASRQTLKSENGKPVLDQLGNSIKESSIHSNLTHADQRQFMLRAKAPGAYFCGVSGTDSKYCPTNFLNTGDLNADAKEFPCDVPPAQW